MSLKKLSSEAALSLYLLSTQDVFGAQMALASDRQTDTPPQQVAIGEVNPFTSNTYDSSLGKLTTTQAIPLAAGECEDYYIGGPSGCRSDADCTYYPNGVCAGCSSGGDCIGNCTWPARQCPLDLCTTGTGHGTVGAEFVSNNLPPNVGGTYSLIATPDVDSTFDGWSPSPCAPTFTMPNSPLTCCATFTKKVFDVTANAWEGGTIDPAAKKVIAKVDWGEYTTFSFTADPGYRFLDVHETASCSNGSLYYLNNDRLTGSYGVGPIQEEGCVVDFFFTKERILVAYTSCDGQVAIGGNSPSSYAIKPQTAGDNITLTANPTGGHKFLDWTPSPCAPNFIMPDNDLTCKARFTHTVTAEAIGYNDNFNPIIAGTITPPSIDVNDGETATFTVTANDGYMIQNIGDSCGSNGVSTGGRLTTVYTTAPVGCSCGVTAYFERRESLYLLSPVKAGTCGGTVSGGGYYAPGDTVKLTATPDAGCTFVGWSPSPCAPSFTMPNHDLTCTASFAAATGDVNGDKSVNALDVVAVINAVLGIQPSPAADVNGDSTVNALDVVFVINKVLGI